MKLFHNISSSSSIYSSAHFIYKKLVQTQLYSTTSIRKRKPKKNNGSDQIPDTFYARILPLGDPNISVSPVLDQWVKEGKRAYRGDLRRAIANLVTYKRFKHALEVSLWMTNKAYYRIDPFDIAIRLKLILKNFGLEQVEKYFNNIPEDFKTYHVYLALLNCYANATALDKAESIMQKARDLGYASKPIWYNHMMKLHIRLGNIENVRDLLAEMESKGIYHDQFTYSICLSAFAMASDVLRMDKVVKIMESNPKVPVHWRAYVAAAEGYLRMGLIDKVLPVLSKLEAQLNKSKDTNILFVFLFRLYAEAGKKDELLRIWNLYKKNGRVGNKGYISMMRSLMKFDDVEGVEKLLAEWESSGLSVDFRVPNFLIDSYCNNDCLEKAEDLITKWVSKGGDPTVITWCHLAGGYLKRNQVSRAVEALKKAISICPPKFSTQMDSLTSCLKQLEDGNCEKAEELITLVRVGGFRKEAENCDLSCGLIGDNDE